MFAIPTVLHREHEQLYRAMRDEAIMVYNRMNQDTSDLTDNLRYDPNTRPPFFWHHIRPERQRWGIQEIWQNAGPLTRPLFNRGNTSGEHGPNWVAGWLLYSVFRSRDVRNNRNRRKGEDHENHHSGQDPKRPKQTTDDTQAKKEFYDPVRNGTL
ncbi:hypothetical protein MW887_010946 [Aspergillus wentii]|nr:hypothetical protein MW887_010946 [Aspergillus wentii]